MKSAFLAITLFLASIFGTHHATSTHPTSPPIAAAVELADNQPSSSQELVATSSGTAATSSAASSNTSSSDTTNSGFVKSPEFNQNTQQVGGTDFITQDQLTAEISNLRALIYQLAASTTSEFTDPQIAANGNGVYYGGVAAPVTQLAASNLIGLTASEIPALNYFSATTTISIAFGGTGTSTAPTANKLLLSDANGNWEYIATSSLGISGGGASLTGTTGQVAYFSGTNTAIGTSSLFITASGKIGIGTASPLAALTVGNLGVNNSVNSQILLSRSVDDTVSGNGHGFSDSSNVTRSGGIGYNSYDAYVTISGSNNFDHYAGFQPRPQFNGSGTITDVYGLVSLPAFNSGTVSNNYGVDVWAPTGSGTVVNNYGLRVKSLTDGTYNWALWTDGATPSYFGGNVGLGTSSPYARLSI